MQSTEKNVASAFSGSQSGRGGPARTTFLDIGHGGCAVIQVGEEGVTVVDCAHSGKLLNFLADRSARPVIENLVISHLDADHYRGVTALLNSRNHVQIRKIFLNPETAAFSKNSTRYNGELLLKFFRALVKRVIRDRLSAFEFIPAGRSLDLGDGYAFEVLWPRALLAITPASVLDEYGFDLDQNGLSLVAKLLSGDDVDVLFTSDVDSGVVQALSSENLKASVLHSPHHGGLIDESDSANLLAWQALLSEVQPAVGVVQNGRNMYDNPRVEVAAALGAAGCYTACTQLNSGCGSDGQGTSSAACAGSIQVLHDLQMVVTEHAHEQFVDNLVGMSERASAPYPRCRLAN